MSNIGNKETMAKNLSYYLNKSGKTQREVCDDLGFLYSTFNEWIKGRKYPRIDKIEMMANYFNILKSDLIEERSIDKNPVELGGIIGKAIKDESFLELLSYYNLLNDDKKKEALSFMKYLSQGR